MNFKLNFQKSFFLIPLAFIFISSSEFISLNDFKLKGKVKKVVLYNYKAQEGTDGKIIRGAWTDSAIYRFNESGKLTSALYFYSRFFINNRTKEIHTYDKDGHLKTSVVYYENSNSDSSSYSYKNGLKTEKISISREGNVSYSPLKTISLYKMDKISSEISFNVKGDTVHEFFYIYNNQGNLVKLIQMEPDSNKRMDSLSTTTFYYNSKGFVSKKNWDVLGHATIAVYEYNAQGNMIYEVPNEDWGVKYFNEYEYDKFGNWIECRRASSVDKSGHVNEKKNPESVSIRTITYY